MTSAVFGCVDTAGRDVVLKVAPPEMRPDLEAAALNAWSGLGAPRLLDFDPGLGALLIERVMPGLPLPAGRDQQAIKSIIGTLKALHAAHVTNDLFPTQAQVMETWFESACERGERGTVGVSLLDRAAETPFELASTTSDSALLHGDFIDKNLLLGPHGYVAVDPMLPRIGDPCSDVGFYAAYHPPARNIAGRARSLARAAELDSERSATWAAVWAVGEATETWRDDSDELQEWIAGHEATALLRG